LINLNHIVIEGNLTRDPETRTFQNGGSVTSFTVACNDDYKAKDAQEWTDRCYFIGVSAGGYCAEAAKRLSKGNKVIVQGKITSRSYEKDGERKYVTEIKADHIMNRTPKPQDGPTEHSRAKASGYAPEPTRGFSSIPAEPFPMDLSEVDTEGKRETDAPF
jgi:single-strand DNA-binding protein